MLILGVLGGVAAYQFGDWAEKSREVESTRAAFEANRSELARLTAEQAATQQVARSALEEATASQRDIVTRHQTALATAHANINEKGFVVRLTGPDHIQPGAPNKWKIEAPRADGVAGWPKKLDVAVKDSKGVVLFKQSHDEPRHGATLELTTAFWEKVKPGTELFLEVIGFTDDDRKSVLAENIPLARPVYVTHLATDKPLYKPGETIRFRSLTLDGASLQPPPNDSHLRFRLRSPGDVIVPLDEGNGRLWSNLQSVLGPDQKPLRGIGVGEHTLSPNAPGGEYKLEVLDVTNNKELLLETRKFIVNKYVPDTFEKKLEFDGKSYGAGEVVQARVEVSRTAGGPMKDATANVVATVDGKTIHEQKDIRFGIVNEGGNAKAALNVRFQLPADIFDKAKPNTPPSATLSVNILDGSDAEAIVRPIPLITKNLSVEFFPEGGDMVEGLPGRVYFQVRTPQGKPADLKGTITDGTNTIAEVGTLTDAESPGVNRGHGVFELTPKVGTRYFLKLNSPVGIIAPTADGFPLPVAKADGVALRSLDAVTDRGGAIRVKVLVNQGPRTLHVGAYARGRLIGHQKLVVDANVPAEVKLHGDDVAGGVTRITVFEEPKAADDAGRAALIPRAERLVYRKPGEQLILNVSPDKARYSPSDKVRLELAALNEKESPTPAILMVGVVNQSVITMADNKTDRLMPTHFLLSGEVKHPAELEHADFLLTEHPKAGVALDLLLATQGWRRFVEQNGYPANPADKVEVERLLVAQGQQTTAPVELFKLETQRLQAEYRPGLELAMMRRGLADRAWQAAQDPNAPGIAAQVATARSVFNLAEGQHKAAVVRLERYVSKYTELVEWVFIGGFFIGLVFLAFYCVLIATTTRGHRWDNALTASVGTALLGVIVLAGITSLGKNANQTFSKIGMAVDGGDGPGMPQRVVATSVERGDVPPMSRPRPTDPTPKPAPAVRTPSSVASATKMLNGVTQADAAKAPASNAGAKRITTLPMTEWHFRSVFRSWVRTLSRDTGGYLV